MPICRNILFHMYPSLAYRWIVGEQLPNGVHAVAYGSVMNDNLFHTGYCWEFENNEAGLHEFLSQMGFQESLDAINVIGQFEDALGIKIPVSNIGTGYEREKDRDDWLLVDRTGNRSFYQKN